MGYKRVLSLMLCFILCFLTLFPTAVFAADKNDIRGHWAENQIKCWIDMGFVQYYADGTFKPDNDITKAEFETIVNKAFGFKEKVKSTYIDKKAPKKLTRQDMAVIITRMLKINTSKDIKTANAFKDAVYMASGTKGPIGAVIRLGYMSGSSNKIFMPRGYITRAHAIAVLDKCYPSYAKALYAKAGTYSANTVKGNVTIKAPNVILQNTVIEGNLTIDKGVGDREVRLKNVVVKGNTLVRGGGLNSIFVEDFQCNNMIVLKENNEVRIVAVGKTSINSVDMLSGGKLEEQALTGDGFSYVTVAETVPAETAIILAGSFIAVQGKAEHLSLYLSQGSIDSLYLEKTASGSKINTAAGTSINNLMIDAATAVGGSGRIDTALVREDNILVTVSAGTTVETLSVASSKLNTKIDLDMGSKINKLILNSATAVSGNGTVGIAQVNVAGTSIVAPVNMINTAPGVTISTPWSKSKGTITYGIPLDNTVLATASGTITYGNPYSAGGTMSAASGTITYGNPINNTTGVSASGTITYGSPINNIAGVKASGTITYGTPINNIKAVKASGSINYGIPNNTVAAARASGSIIYGMPINGVTGAKASGSIIYGSPINGVNGVKASGSIIYGNPLPGETYEVNGNIFTKTEADDSGNNFSTISSLKDHINSMCGVNAIADESKITITALAVGVTGNLIKIGTSATNASVSGNFLSGGVDAVAGTTFRVNGITFTAGTDFTSIDELVGLIGRLSDISAVKNGMSIIVTAISAGTLGNTYTLATTNEGISCAVSGNNLTGGVDEVKATTFSINGSTFTTGTDFTNIDGLVSLINAAPNISAIKNGNSITITANSTGSVGNTNTLAITNPGSGCAVSGSNFTGGINATTATAFKVNGALFTSGVDFRSIDDLVGLINKLPNIGAIKSGMSITITANNTGTSGNANTLAVVNPGVNCAVSGGNFTGGIDGVLGTTFTVYGTTFTKASYTDAGYFNSISDLTAKINGITNLNATQNGATTIIITAKNPGVAGNTITLSRATPGAGCAVSGATLTGGVEPIGGTAFIVDGTTYYKTASDYTGYNFDTIAHLASKINSMSNVSATYSGSVIIITARVSGVSGNYITLGRSNPGTGCAVSGSTLTGGSNAAGGTTFTVDGTTYYKTASNYTGNNFDTIERLTAKINSMSRVSATDNGYVITITSRTLGTTGNYITLASSNPGTGCAISGLTLSGGGDITATTFTVDGRIFTKTLYDNTGNNFDTIAHLTAKINNMTSVSAVDNGYVITITARMPGIAGNYITLGRSNPGTGCAISGSTLAGGLNAVGGTTFIVDGSTYYKTASDNTGNNFDTIGHLTAKINSMANVSAVDNGYVITITARAPGISGNSIILKLERPGVGTSVSGSGTLTGGSN